MPNMRLLHSGFLAYPRADLGKVAEVEGNYRTAVLNQNQISLDTSNWYDVEVDALMNHCVNTKKAIASFEFRESVLKKAMELFGAPASFADWVSMQRFSPAVTYMHRRFLQETLAYAYNGTERRMSIATYREVLFTGLDSTVHAAADNTADFKDIFETIASLRNVENTELFINWTRGEHAIQDLLMTLDVIFGLRLKKGA